ncbi:MULTISPECIES: phenylacetate--CoA ligase family protein [Pseudoalteromonas]|uniref:Phenylacetate--CoA ligase family protein n=1 Tax=Pseudoalteromonas maricaloris TaxID=184924 RepID=A0A8I2H787_9GAMM|nr:MULTISPECIES: phenylacetate--CoA ligase family protein [Pseudoalteromonas]KID39290.1 hypothetical protein QT15_01415 [Pseudoalteromonas flavipulchra NCIMB 2033 = ATCC BAA-314]MBD0784301.1 phenylacetate--CoA ligase family protein [Pseudoalteromonas flavipulchra]MBE0374959.1 phenylacetate-CoA ligase [Pseudoalteromonas flavipulchra NCIMB 2033 = ATCC BAA-314]NLR24341.1 phenylacetate--CoA ligase family protein [Pseudoalteromonas maricaloris]QUI61470.1 phenylacetate--CoA ligase family protein [Ps
MTTSTSEALLDEVYYAYNKVPFFKKHIDKSGVSINQIMDSKDISLLPLTEKRDFRKHFPVGVFAQGYSMGSPLLTRSQSSGTTGDRLVTFELGMLLIGRAVACTEVNAEVEHAFVKTQRKIVRYAAPNCSDVECANPNSSKEDRTLSDGTLVLPVYHDLLTTSEHLIETAIKEIIEYQPDLYYVDPTHFAFLIGEFQKRGIIPPKAPIICSYSSVTALNRRRILSGFDQAVTFSELLSCSEMGWVAMECCHGALHLNDSSFHIEILNDNGEQVEHGEIGELVISSIDQGAVPHIRYKTGDYLRLDETPCRCGHSHRKVSVIGRASNCIALGDGTQVWASTLDSLIGAPKGLKMYQLHQHTNDYFSLKLIAEKDFEQTQLSASLAKLKSLLGLNSHLDISYVDYIATERSGKFQIIKTDLNG